MEQHYDLLVIGAGSGALGCARSAAQFGKRVAMIENRRIGGTCVNAGCVPKKVMFNLANFLEEVHLMKDYGVNGLDDVALDFATFKQRRDAFVERLNTLYHTNLKSSGIDYFPGTAMFESAKTVLTSEGRRFTATHILIASGSHPKQPPMPGGEYCWSSDDIFTMEKLPSSIIILGGGYIAVEMAQIMSAFGVETILVARNTILTLVDQELIPVLLESMKKQGLVAHLKTPFDSVQKLPDGQLQVNFQNGGAVLAERVLCALGRPPNIEPLNLAAAGVEVEKGAIKIDEYQNTNIPGIYALGDVTDQVNLTPVAIRSGRILAQRLFDHKPHLKMSYQNIATVIFSHPTIGVIGLTEEHAKERFGANNITVHKSTFINMFYSLALTDDLKHKTMFKLICHKEADGTETVIGAHMIGKHVDEMMQTASVAITMGATKQDFDNSVAIHPTASEELVTMQGNYIF